jgi:N-acetyl-gamma-glutamyl-phosphate/LysW-gamma-L-alpha-aminoadipyl-6-phosphate reductase
MMNRLAEFEALADTLIDLSADFRIHDPQEFETWYGKPHSCPERMNDFVYGIPELHRAELKGAKRISGAGCNATATLLALHPLYQAGIVESSVVEVKAGSSQGGNAVSEGSHHPERSGAVRSYKPTAHRHLGEIRQELKAHNIHFSATSIEMVRGILATCHVFLNQALEEKDIWKIYRTAYGDEPFIRIVKERTGIHRFPEPKILAGSNYCDIGFERDPFSNRLVVISAIDNLMKGAAGQAVQAFNIAQGFDETTGLEFPGLHPV